MKLSEKWLREFVNPDISRDALIYKLNMAGIAVESCLPSESDPSDFIFEFELTPNRGDCLSVLGIAREVSVLTNTVLTHPVIHKSPVINQSMAIHKINNKKIFDIQIQNQTPQDCPYYTGALITGFFNHDNDKNNKNIKNSLPSTPVCITQKLQKSGLKLIHPIVDSLNYVMLELGQPLHAFDADKLQGNKIIIRKAKNGEKMTALDQKTLMLTDDVLVIADQTEIIALAGIIGGLNSAVDSNTKTIFIESAFFTPESIAGRARRFGLHTDASQRFERGVDYTLPKIALARVTEILREIYPDLKIEYIAEKSYPDNLPKVSPIVLRYARLEQMLGIKLSESRIKTILNHLNMLVSASNLSSCNIIPPDYRFDLTQEIDIIEEIARIYGYENIVSNSDFQSQAVHPFRQIHQACVNISHFAQFKNLLVSQGYQEIISYSFISEKIQAQLDAHQKPLKLSNPLSAELAVMRTNLWAGLINAVQYNANRQQTYLRFFEYGLKFANNQQASVLSGVWAGKAFEEQWSESKRHVDFFDLKNTLSQLFSLARQTIVWAPGFHSALHPGQTAKILLSNTQIGICGALHPELQQALGLKIPVFLFEIDINNVEKPPKQAYQVFSKYPAVRRDISLFIDQAVSVALLKNTILTIVQENQQQADLSVSCCTIEIMIFDVYQMKNTAQKSVALGLIFQALDRTLLEQEIQALMSVIIEKLALKTGAILRE